jgi:effector-binding domain-containing protein
VISAPDLAARNELISGHLSRLEANLARTREAASSLRELLQPPAACAPVVIEHRQVPATEAAAVREVVDVEDLPSWWQGALGELYAIVTAQQLGPSSHAGGIFDSDLFKHDRGEATVYVPCTGPVRPTGRVTSLTIPAVELAVITHTGSHQDVDRAYGALANYVTEHALGIDGPLREFYIVGAHDTTDQAQWRTEIGWPIFHTGADSVSQL